VGRAFSLRATLVALPHMLRLIAAMVEDIPKVHCRPNGMLRHPSSIRQVVLELVSELKAPAALHSMANTGNGPCSY
jgi:hypothetical protein